MTETKSKRKFHWGYGIAALYGGFVVFTLAIVGYASFQHFDLVDKDYYARGVDYEQQIERIKRVEALPEKPRYEFLSATGEVVLHFPKSFAAGEVSGTVVLFRPSAASMDISVGLVLDPDLSQRIKSDRLVAGLWRAKLSWKAGGQEYYNEQELMLQ